MSIRQKLDWKFTDGLSTPHALFCKPIIVITCLTLTINSSNRCYATVVLSHEWPILAVRDTQGYLDDVLSIGDMVHVYAYYDPDVATLFCIKRG